MQQIDALFVNLDIDDHQMNNAFSCSKMDDIIKNSKDWDVDPTWMSTVPGFKYDSESK